MWISQFNHVEDIDKLNEYKTYVLDRIKKGALKPVVKVFVLKIIKKPMNICCLTSR
jgi:hypothetical protein